MTEKRTLWEELEGLKAVLAVGRIIINEITKCKFCGENLDILPYGYECKNCGYVILNSDVKKRLDKFFTEEKVKEEEIIYNDGWEKGYETGKEEIKQRIKEAVRGLIQEIIRMEFEHDKEGNIYISLTKRKIIDSINKRFADVFEEEEK